MMYFFLAQQCHTSEVVQLQVTESLSADSPVQLCVLSLSQLDKDGVWQ